MVGVLAVVTVVCGFAVNVGVLVATRTAVQRAADAAVLAGCADLPNVATAKSRAIDYGQNKNGGVGEHLEAGNTVTFPSPQPPSGGLPNDTFQVQVQRPAPIIGSFVVGDSSARATCRRVEGPRPALQALGSGGNRLWVHSGAAVNLGNTGVVVSSTATNGLVVDGGASVVGRFLDTASGTATINGTVDPPVERPPDPSLLLDPFASVKQPDQLPTPFVVDLGVVTITLQVPPLIDAALPAPQPGCVYSPPLQPTTTPLLPAHCHITSNATLNPGMYWGGLELGNPSGGPTTITLLPGIYYLAGGGNGGHQGGLRLYPNTRLVGSNVIIYNGRDQWASLVGLQGCGPMLIAQNARLELSPPGGGPYRGMLFFQERSCTEAATFQVPVLGVANSPGATYVPNAGITLTGPTMLHGIVVARNIDVFGNLGVDVVIPSGTLFHGQVHLIE